LAVQVRVSGKIRPSMLFFALDTLTDSCTYRGSSEIKIVIVMPVLVGLVRSYG
jgi:hypothetical protein